MPTCQCRWTLVYIFSVSKTLPEQFDWRDRNGVNYISPVRNQESCGSCYAFGSMAMYEARLRIATNNTVQKVFSTQDVVSCSEYSQGCNGGFPYLVAGKFCSATLIFLKVNLQGFDILILFWRIYRSMKGMTSMAWCIKFRIGHLCHVKI